MNVRYFFRDIKIKGKITECYFYKTLSGIKPGSAAYKAPDIPMCAVAPLLSSIIFNQNIGVVKNSSVKSN